MPYTATCDASAGASRTAREAGANTARVARTASGPERRTMATPPACGTTGVATATIVAPSSSERDAAAVTRDERGGGDARGGGRGGERSRPRAKARRGAAASSAEAKIAPATAPARPSRGARARRIE